MNMNQRLCIFLLLFFIGSGLKSQNAFLQVEGGYSFPLSPSSVQESMNVKLTEQGGTVESPGSFSLGQGVHFGVVAGGYFLPGLGAGLRVQHIVSTPIEITGESNIGSTVQLSKKTINSSIWVFSPELRMFLPDYRVSPFMTFGVSFAGGSLKITENIDRQGIEFIKLWEYKGKYSGGVNASGGLLFRVSKNLDIHLQCRINPLSYTPERAEMYKASRDGTDNRLEYPVIEREIEFLNEITTEYGTAPDPDKPDKRFRTLWAAGGIQLSGGVVFLF